MSRTIRLNTILLLLHLLTDIECFHFSASEATSRLAELRRGRLGTRLPPAGQVRGRHQELAAHGRGLSLPQRLHTNGRLTYIFHYFFCLS